MFRKIADQKSTASVNQTGLVTQMYDDGWEDLLDCRRQFTTEAEGRAYLMSAGYEEYDPNASLKAMGLVWNGYIYARPGA